MRCLRLLPLLLLPAGLMAPGQVAALDDAPEDAAEEGPRQVILFELASPPHAVLRDVRVEMDRLGDQKTVVLRDDGFDPSDFGHDGVFVGRDEGPYARYVNVRVLATGDRRDELLYSGVLRTSDTRLVRLAFETKRLESGLTAFRSTSAYPGESFSVEEGLPLIAAFGWGMFALFYVMGLAGLFRREKER
jgi:hypothetical protein